MTFRPRSWTYVTGPRTSEVKGGFCGSTEPLSTGLLSPGAVRGGSTARVTNQPSNGKKKFYGRLSIGGGAYHAHMALRRIANPIEATEAKPGRPRFALRFAASINRGKTKAGIEANGSEGQIGLG